MKRVVFCLIGTIGSCAWAIPGHAQRQPRMTLDATIGPGVVRTDGRYLDNGGDVTLDGMLGVRVRTLAHGALFAGVNAGTHSGWGGEDVIDCIPTPTIDCPQDLPSFEMFGATLGWQDRQAILRVSTGAAYVQADWDGWSVAWQSRVDLAMPTTWHLAPVMSLRATVVPNYPNGDRFRLFALGFGLRVQ